MGEEHLLVTHRHGNAGTTTQHRDVTYLGTSVVHDARAEGEQGSMGLVVDNEEVGACQDRFRFDEPAEMCEITARLTVLTILAGTGLFFDGQATPRWWSR